MEKNKDHQNDNHKRAARLNLGISILYIPPRSAPPSLMAFKEPFSTDVYIAILVIFIFAAFIIYFLARSV